MKFPLKITLAVIIISFLLVGMVVVALYFPNSLHTNSDFLAMYDADLRLLQHFGPYGYRAQILWMAQQANTAVENIYVPQFPYPPWIPLSTFYLGYLPIQSAAMLWFEINLILLFSTVWFLSAGWHSRLRLISFLAPFLFIPVIGTLGVGQYGFPVLLGSAILIHAIRHKLPVLTSIGTALLTYKPHIGLPVVLVIMIYLHLRHDVFGRRALRWVIGGIAFLCIISLTADPLWFIDYPRSFLTYQTGADIASCAACDSVPAWLANHFIANPTLPQMTGIGAILFILLVLFFGSVGSHLKKSADYLVNISLLIVLMVIPHLYNYDFILLIVPFALLAEKSHSWPERIFLIILYLLPFFAIEILGRTIGDPSLLLVTLALALLVFIHAHDLPQLDVSPDAA